MAVKIRFYLKLGLAWIIILTTDLYTGLLLLDPSGFYWLFDPKPGDTNQQLEFASREASEWTEIMDEASRDKTSSALILARITSIDYQQGIAHLDVYRTYAGNISNQITVHGDFSPLCPRSSDEIELMRQRSFCATRDMMARDRPPLRAGVFRVLYIFKTRSGKYFLPDMCTGSTVNFVAERRLRPIPLSLRLSMHLTKMFKPIERLPQLSQRLYWVDQLRTDLARLEDEAHPGCTVYVQHVVDLINCGTGSH